ncbi:MAG: hypothetical protein COW85_15435 [Ignavibacteria bacterium CG22_combo_CG10-13_8_21_14_all_37_15]|nr:MAG: hypothetical protein COW85_15435 [Ignavibacteria bacterium CG22_combo_CG10-13_8_21_14_all_37_15]PIQ10440.1 MAG: hypothetical protein COW71_02765 [Ignavibacteriales bacterium CG18_big_fil_WC_8_21_14_2_50_31_20]
MKKKFLFITLTLAILTSSGCYTVNTLKDQLQNWMGRTETELIHSWGAPSRDYPDGKGGKILIYNEKDYDGSTRIIQMYINKESKIYYFQVRWE